MPVKQGVQGKRDLRRKSLDRTDPGFQMVERAMERPLEQERLTVGWESD